MLTFTEFFTKKKIDIIALQKSRPDLYQEFDRDYALMGEKSFDHSKKFWFNRLRKEYLLEEIEIPAEEKKEVVKPDVTSSVNVESKSPEVSDPGNTTAKPAGFKPRFKSANIKKPAEIETPKEEETSDSVNQAGFKPRFKASNLPKPAATETSKEEETTDSIKSEAPAAEATAQDEKKATKPAGFKPRFKASNLPKPAVTETPKEEETTGPVKQEAPTAELSAAEATAAETPAADEKKAVKPAGFKPRFKASNLPKPAVTETPKIEETTDSVKPEVPTAEVSPAEEPAVEEKKAVKPAGFKPRFKASNLPKKLEDNPEEGKTNKTEDKKDKEDDN